MQLSAMIEQWQMKTKMKRLFLSDFEMQCEVDNEAVGCYSLRGLLGLLTKMSVILGVFCCCCFHPRVNLYGFQMSLRWVNFQPPSKHFLLLLLGQAYKGAGGWGRRCHQPSASSFFAFCFCWPLWQQLMSIPTLQFRRNLNSPLAVLYSSSKK